MRVHFTHFTKFQLAPKFYVGTLCSNDRASLISKYRRNQLDATNSDLLVINSISTCFGHLYAYHQEKLAPKFYVGTLCSNDRASLISK